VAWASNHEAASDQCPAASSPGWSRAAALARLEPESAPARLYAARAIPTHRGEPTTFRRSLAMQSGSDPFPRAACPLSPLMGRAACSQCTGQRSRPGFHHPVRRSRSLRRLPRSDEHLSVSIGVCQTSQSSSHSAV